MQYHTGGVVGKKPQGNSLPKMHEGGSVSSLMKDRPMHNEIDIRALRNEMILTEGMQANLAELLETGSIGFDKQGSVQDLQPLVDAITKLAGRPVVIELDGDAVGSATFDVNMRFEEDLTTTQLLVNGVKERS